MIQRDGSMRIAWQAEGYVAIHVYAQFWPHEALADFASQVADAALTNRTVPDLRRELRRRFGGTFDLQAPDEDAPDRRVVVAFHPPPGEPNPDE
ncbi:MAG: hypothetical protein M3N29_07840 [Chloroflexota bacterium]|nr:hypothetical protein [Chloroflexota bacterium]